MKKELKGIIKDLSNEDYHGEKKHLSSSNLKVLLKDPAKFYDEKILGNRKPMVSNALDEGSLAHAYILEPHVIPDEFAMWEEFRKANPAGTKKWDEFKAANEGKIIISKPQRKRVESWVEGYHRNKTAVSLIEDCEPELSLFGELNNVPIKVRADGINVEGGYIIDVKTTAFETDVDSFKMTIQQFQYDLSAALYCEMFKEHYGKEFDFYFVVLGKRDSSCEVFKLSENSKNKGLSMVRRALAKYKKCVESGDWSSVDKLEKKIYNNYEILEV